MKSRSRTWLIAVVIASTLLIRTDAVGNTKASVGSGYGLIVDEGNAKTELIEIKPTAAAKVNLPKITSKEAVSEESEEIKTVLFESPMTGKTYNIKLQELVDTYSIDEKIPEWDVHGRYKEINTVYKFLVEQMGADEVLAAAVIGNIACEGKFAQEQKTKEVYTSTKDIIACLEDKSKKGGYGIVQWTSRERKENLIQFYEAAEKVTKTFTECKILAECMFLYEEFLAYDIYDSWKSEAEIEDACGRVAVLYEGYGNCSKEWKVVDGKYELNSKDKSGNARLNYAINILKKFE